MVCNLASRRAAPIAGAWVLRTRAASGVLASLVVAVLATGYWLHVTNRDRAIERIPRDETTAVLSTEYRQLQMVTAGVVLALLAAGYMCWREGHHRMAREVEAARKASAAHSHAELRALNAKLESVAQEWRLTVDTIDSAVVLVEPSGVVLRLNRSAAATLPGALTAWPKQPADRLADHAPWGAALTLARETVGGDAVSTARIHDATSRRTWDLWCRPLTGSHSRQAVVIVARDVSGVVELQETLRRSETMAALGSVVVGVAHEVRNPLFAISSLVDAWAIQPHRDPRPFVEALRSEVGRLRTLMVELLEYGRPSASTRCAQAIAPVIDEAIRACTPEAEARGVRITGPSAIDAEVLMDARRLVRVFINLIQNAVQHSPAAAEVSVEIDRADRDEPSLTVVVRDRGQGFAPNDLARVFTPFFSRRTGGFGLGLAISERIVAEHQGRIVAANHPVGGATLTVVLPLIRRERNDTDHARDAGRMSVSQPLTDADGTPAAASRESRRDGGGPC